MHEASLEYRNAVESFLEFAFPNVEGSERIVFLVINAKFDIIDASQKMKWYTILCLMVCSHTTKSGRTTGRRFLGLLFIVL